MLTALTLLVESTAFHHRCPQSYVMLMVVIVGTQEEICCLKLLEQPDSPPPPFYCRPYIKMTVQARVLGNTPI